MRARLCLGLVLALTVSGRARADVLPEPYVPEEWDEHPAPVPEPPPEKSPDWSAAPVSALLLALLALAVLRRSTSTATQRVADDPAPT